MGPVSREHFPRNCGKIESRFRVPGARRFAQRGGLVAMAPRPLVTLRTTPLATHEDIAGVV
jgi:hypothetical protein